MHEIVSRVFEWSYLSYLIIALMLITVWLLVALLFRKHQKVWRIINTVCAAATVFSILFITLFSRSGGKQSLQFVPFGSFELARVYNDVYKQMVMNILLFIPFGMTATFAIGRKYAVLWTIAAAILLSASIELLQYIFVKGETEIDDVIFNTIGAAIGTLPFLVSKQLSGKNGKTINE